jgi:hypothetical protein
VLKSRKIGDRFTELGRAREEPANPNVYVLIRIDSRGAKEVDGAVL